VTGPSVREHELPARDNSIQIVLKYRGTRAQELLAVHSGQRNLAPPIPCQYLPERGFEAYPVNFPEQGRFRQFSDRRVRINPSTTASTFPRLPRRSPRHQQNSLTPVTSASGFRITLRSIQRIVVSLRIKEEFSNSKEYYRLYGLPLREPEIATCGRPSGRARQTLNFRPQQLVEDNSFRQSSAPT
jgi:hypothetical protein